MPPSLKSRFPGGDVLAIRADGHAAETVRSPEGEQLLSAGPVPYTDGLVGTCGDDALAIRAEYDAVDVVGVSQAPDPVRLAPAQRTEMARLPGLLKRLIDLVQDPLGLDQVIAFPGAQGQA